MKRKIFLAIATIFGLALVLGLTNVNLGFVEAKAEAPNLNKVYSYSYKTEYLLEEANYAAFEGKSKITDGRKVEFSLTSDGTNLVSYPTDKQESEMTKTELDAKVRDAGTSVEFISAGVYTFTVKDVRTDEGITLEPDSSFTVTTSGKPGEDSVKFNLAGTAREDYKAEIEKSLKIKDEKADGGERPIQTGDSFSVPSVEDLISCEYFDYADLTRTVYYAAPQSSSYTSTSSSSFKVNAVGTYSFYVLVKDPLNNSTKVTDLVIGEGGWYAKDDDGNPTGNVIIPIFTFDVEVVTEPSVVVGVSEKAFVNLAYGVECFTITATDYETKYTLYYSDKAVSRDGLTDDEYNDAIAALTEVTKENGFEEKNLLSSTNTFTPVKKGYYYVQLHVVDTANVPATVSSNAIVALDEFKEVKLEFDFGAFLSNNLMSVICIGVAVICLISIIVLLCIKPKEEKTLETKEENK